jgi:hypothetical protein
MVAGLRKYFYADEGDLAALLSQLKSEQSLRFTDMHWQESETMLSYVDPCMIPGLGKVGANANCPSVGYLVTKLTDPLVTRGLKFADGITRYSVGRYNHDSVRISFGGDAGSETLVCSLVDTLGKTSIARDIHHAVSKIVIQLGVKCGRFTVLQGAASKLKIGWRLTEGVSRPSTSDFTLQHYNACCGNS